VSKNILFSNIWKWQDPEENGVHLWKVAKNALLTNVQRCQRGMSVDNACPKCREAPKDMLHLMGLILEDAQLLCLNCWPFSLVYTQTALEKGFTNFRLSLIY